MFCLAALSSRLLLASLSSTAFSRALIRSSWSSENAQNSQGTVSCCLPVARHHGQLFGSHPARAAGRQRPALPSRRPPVGSAEAAGGGPDARFGHESTRAPTALSRSPSLLPAGRGWRAPGTPCQEAGPSLCRVPLPCDPSAPALTKASRGPRSRGLRDPGGPQAPGPARPNGPAWAETAPPLHPKGRTFRPRQRRNAEELGLLERK